MIATPVRLGGTGRNYSNPRALSRYEVSERPGLGRPGSVDLHPHMAQPLKVLVVDDSRSSLALSVAYLKAAYPDCEIVTAPDGSKALDQLPADLAIGILDMNMPGMNGIELAAAIHARAPHTRLALLTANAQDSIRARAEANGLRFFKKPVTAKVIKDIVDTLAPREA